MIYLKVKTKRLAITLLLLITIIITSGFVVKISAIEKSIESFALQNIAIKKMNVVVVRKSELMLVSLNNIDKNITLDSGGIFSRPLISPNKTQVSYLKDNVLYITTNNLEHIKVAPNVPQLSFAWQDKNSLLYSPKSGGIYSYDVVHKISKLYLKNEYNYENITLNSSGKCMQSNIYSIKRTAMIIDRITEYYSLTQ